MSLDLVIQYHTKQIVKVLKNGYKIPFKSIRPPSFCDNNKSMLKEKDFAYQELLRLESLGCISRVKERPYIVLPLSVVFNIVPS